MSTFSNALNIPSVNGTVVVGTGTGFSDVAYSSTPTASNIMYRDSNGNSSANNLSLNSTGNAAVGTITLTAASSFYQVFSSGAGSATVVLPNATTLATGWRYQFNNNASGVITVQANGGGTLFTMPSGSYVTLILTSTSFPAGQWDYHWEAPSNTQWGTAGLNVTGYVESSTLTASAPVIANSSKQLTSTALTNGQLLIGNSGTIPSAATLTSTQGFNVMNGSGSITLSNLRNGAKYVVSSVSGQGGYTTIGAAITQASSDGVSSIVPATILVWPGTYTENVVLQDYINIVALDNGVNIVGAMTYPTGIGVVFLQNLTISNSSTNPVLEVVAAAAILINNCIISSNSSGSAFVMTNSSGSFNIDSSTIYCSSSGSAIDISYANGNFYNCEITGSTSTASSVNTTSSVSMYNCNISDYYDVNDTATLNTYYCNLTSSSNPCVNVAVGATFSAISTVLSSNSTYYVDGSGNFLYSGISLPGSSITPNPVLAIVSYPWSTGLIICNNNISTNPGSSASSSLSLGSAYQNTLGYDVVLTVYVAVSAATSGSILSGSGASSSPTQQTVVSGLTTASTLIIPVTIYLANKYYALISTSGTITATISGQQVTPV